MKQTEYNELKNLIISSFQKLNEDILFMRNKLEAMNKYYAKKVTERMIVPNKEVISLVSTIKPKKKKKNGSIKKSERS